MPPRRSDPEGDGEGEQCRGISACMRRSTNIVWMTEHKTPIEQALAEAGLE